jgi:hypothetical protein
MAEIGEGNVIVSTKSGASVLVVPRESGREDGTDFAESITSGGAIYTDIKDMPSLEALLAEYQVATAVIWKEPSRAVPSERIIGTSVVAGAITAIGAALLAVDLASAAHPNPYISLMLLIGGLGLIATIVVALRTEA